ncbi:hypothetical protein [Blastopirellula retiformator]|uniref:Uncharacterized protein n=1 Tax=Blastopirellula retiformator TaxID=2527970 RepID=A0A5C5UWI1_9BACT|nr:hypothetical protein [Blastopirellula retiformator]TWT30726.1 hypothetical protein Enr8_42490 [Blastopirellula retiformator]
MTLKPVNTKIFVNRDRYSLLPFAVMVPEVAKSAVELDGESGVLRLARPEASPIQDAGLCYLNGPQITGPTLSGSCSQGVIAQALIRQDDSDGVDNKALIVPGALVGPVESSQGLAAGGAAYRFLGFEGCPIDAPVDPQRPKHKFRIGWVAPSFSQSARFFKCEELRHQYVYPYSGAGLVFESNRASLAGGATRPIVSGFNYRAFDPSISPESSPDFRSVKWGAPSLPSEVSGDTLTPIDASQKGAAQLRCVNAGVFQIGFTASIKPVQAGSDVRGMTFGLLVERSAYKYESGVDLTDNESGIFRTDYQEGVYVRPENWAWFEEVDSYFYSVSGQTIINANVGDRIHVVNAATGVLEVRYLNVWGHTLPASGLAFG